MTMQGIIANKPYVNPKYVGKKLKSVRADKLIKPGDYTLAQVHIGADGNKVTETLAKVKINKTPLKTKIKDAFKNIWKWAKANKKFSIPIAIAAGVLGVGAVLKGAKKGEKLDTQA